MSAGGAAMPELGSKISLISKADIRYEGRLFTVDPQECTIALSNVRSFGTEDRECSFPVSPQNQIYDYILFRGSDIKDIRVVNTVNPVPNDPAIVTLSVPQPLASSSFQQQQAPAPQPAPVFGGSGMLGQMRQSVPPFGSSYNSVAANLSSGILSHQDSAKILSSECPQDSMSPPRPGGAKVDESPIDLMSGRAMTPVNARKSPTMDQSTQSDQHGKSHQVGAIGSRGAHRQQGERDGRDFNRGGGRGGPHRGGWNNYDREGWQNYAQHLERVVDAYSHGRNEGDNRGWGQQNNRGAPGGWRGGARRGRGGRGGAPFIRGGGPQQQGGPHPQQGQQQGGPNAPNQKRNVLKFEGDYDFEQANTEFENLRSQLAKIKITATAAGSSNVGIKMATAADVTPGPLKAALNGGDTSSETKEKQPEIENKDDESGECFYDKEVSFFDNISCEAIERSKGASQRTDWRQERKLNSETFGVSSARRGYRGGRGGYYRGGSGYRGNYNNRGAFRGNRGGYNNQRNQQQNQQQQQPLAVGAQRGKPQN
ncbi:protein LSM14 homolog B isoform X2 [Neocloeon triangulifer]|uniref:protein LSM14 homolog B isoform X2 n=1 Tax=Neocloeon triangulifer TaxID=2078957 RepID=UPI00286F9964|nr:protein LSM14 homolog B isoform X2 [Neocloeon triangulifer]